MFQPSLIKSLKLSYRMSCQTDENGNLYPFALSAIRQDSNSHILNDTCKFKLLPYIKIMTWTKWLPMKVYQLLLEIVITMN